MRIQLKEIYKHFLLIGISALTVSLAGCGQEIEYRMTVELIFQNTTTSQIGFSIRPDINSSGRENITLVPQSQSTVFTYEIDGVDKNPNIETCCQDLLVDVYGGRGTNGNSQVLRLDNDLCVIHLNEKSIVLSNYSKEIISERHFKYSYTFTDTDIENPQPCQ